MLQVRNNGIMEIMFLLSLRWIRSHVRWFTKDWHYPYFKDEEPKSLVIERSAILSHRQWNFSAAITILFLMNLVRFNPLLKSKRNEVAVKEWERGRLFLKLWVTVPDYSYFICHQIEGGERGKKIKIKVVLIKRVENMTVKQKIITFMLSLSPPIIPEYK